jgi:hypothetical protein
VNGLAGAGQVGQHLRGGAQLGLAAERRLEVPGLLPPALGRGTALG